MILRNDMKQTSIYALHACKQSAAPTTSGGSGLGAGRTAGARDAATRRSTPVFSGSRAQDDDDDALFPKARGLIKKEAKKNTTFSNGEVVRTLYGWMGL